jgi:hypothetical protein
MKIGYLLVITCYHHFKILKSHPMAPWWKIVERLATEDGIMSLRTILIA